MPYVFCLGERLYFAYQRPSLQVITMSCFWRTVVCPCTQPSPFPTEPQWQKHLPPRQSQMWGEYFLFHWLGVVVAENTGYFIGKTLKLGPNDVSLKHHQASSSSLSAHLHVQFSLAILLGAVFWILKHWSSPIILTTYHLTGKPVQDTTRDTLLETGYWLLFPLSSNILHIGYSSIHLWKLMEISDFDVTK